MLEGLENGLSYEQATRKCDELVPIIQSGECRFVLDSGDEGISR